MIISGDTPLGKGPKRGAHPCRNFSSWRTFVPLIPLKWPLVGCSRTSDLLFTMIGIVFLRFSANSESYVQKPFENGQFHGNKALDVRCAIFGGDPGFISVYGHRLEPHNIRSPYPHNRGKGVIFVSQIYDKGI